MNLDKYQKEDKKKVLLWYMIVEFTLSIVSWIVRL